DGPGRDRRPQFRPGLIPGVNAVKCAARLTGTIVVGGMILLAAGCSQPLKPMQFNNKIAKTNQKLSEAAKKFYKALKTMSKRQPPGSDAQSAYNEITSALRAAKQDFDSISPPPGPRGSDLMAKYQSFLQAQQSIYDNVITPIWNIVQDPSRPEPGVKWSFIQPLLQKASSDESRAMEPLRNSHQEYCKYYGLEPK